jgi:ditrans,polycis-polyprenyl diphosphate synthase
LRLNIRCVTVYAFAIDNFKRSPAEVDALMNLAEQKLLELCEHGALLDRYGVRLNVLGRLELLPERVRVAINIAHEKTHGHERAVLNICMSYNSRDDITSAVQETVRETLNQGKNPE